MGEGGEAGLRGRRSMPHSFIRPGRERFREAFQGACKALQHEGGGAIWNISATGPLLRTAATAMQEAPDLVADHREGGDLVANSYREGGDR